MCANKHMPAQYFWKLLRNDFQAQGSAHSVLSFFLFFFFNRPLGIIKLACVGRRDRLAACLADRGALSPKDVSLLWSSPTHPQCSAGTWPRGKITIRYMAPLASLQLGGGKPGSPTAAKATARSEPTLLCASPPARDAQPP